MSAPRGHLGAVPKAPPRDRLRFTPPDEPLPQPLRVPCQCRACRLSRRIIAALVGVIVGGLAGVLVLTVLQ